MTGLAVVGQAAEAPFDEFWRLYPRKVGKPLARAKFEAITNGGLKTKTLDRDSGSYVDLMLKATPDEILAGLKAWRASLGRRADFSLDIDERYTPHPSTWLNQGRWQDNE